MFKKFSIYFIIAILLFTVKIQPAFALIYTVTASITGGHGTVTPVTQKIKPNTRATITIKPDVGYHIDTITDNGQKAKVVSPYVIPYVNENHDIIFTFAINTYTISASASGGHGKVEPKTQTVTHGDKASLTITPDEGYKITGIIDNGNLVGIANPFNLTNIIASHNIVVAFTTFTVTASVTNGHGKVEPLLQTIPSGAKATLTIKPDIGYQIDKIWDNDKEVKVTNPYIIPGVTANRKIAVSFTTAVLTIKASVADKHGEITPELSKVLYRGEVKLRITANDGYHITGLTDNGIPMPITSILTLTNVTTDHTIVVSFIEFEITTRMIEDHGAIIPNRQSIFSGGTATITIKSDPGYKINYILDNKAWKSPTTPTSYVITNVTEDHFVEVSYIAITFTVKAIVAGGNGTASPAIQTVRYGSSAMLIFKADPGYRITGIMDNGKPKVASSPYKIESVTEDRTVIVTFLAFAVFANVIGGHGSLAPATQYIYAGNKASIVIIPEAGYHIDKIVDNEKIMPIKSPYQILNVLENHAVDISFAINTYTVTATVSGGHGTVTPATQTLNYGSKGTLLITPEKGYIIESITDNGISVPIWNPYSVYYITANHTVVVKFKPIK